MSAALPVDLTPSQQARRQRIVDAGLTLLRERDYEKIQVKDVAEAANVALGTVYRYFSSKEHIFAEVLVAWAAGMGTNISRHPLKGTTDAARLIEVYHRSVRAFQHQPSLARLVATLETSSDPYATGIFDRLSTTTNPVYLDAIHDLSSDEAARVVRVVDAVLATSLRTWSANRAPIARVYDDLSNAIELLLAP
ncbi:MAG TPA: TetR/AcrR family transcriptional regulator [Acidimicrobiia bacterium]|jgi:AcrR family transcriptional regulator|nr:TetR/AcrR family transcriptional regulator [Acidimicrobiia bacterium]